MTTKTSTDSTTNETRIQSDPDVPMVRITREFDAPASAVFRAHTDPDLLVQWLGPRALTMTIDHYECRPGGSYRYVHTGDGQEHAFRGCFHDVRENELIVQTFSYEPYPDSVALERLTLTDLPGGRCRLETTSLLESFEGRDGLLSSGMEAGVNEGHAKLDDLLARS